MENRRMRIKQRKFKKNWLFKNGKLEEENIKKWKVEKGYILQKQNKELEVTEMRNGNKIYEVVGLVLVTPIMVKITITRLRNRFQNKKLSYATKSRDSSGSSLLSQRATN